MLDHYHMLPAQDRIAQIEVLILNGLGACKTMHEIAAEIDQMLDRPLSRVLPEPALSY